MTHLRVPLSTVLVYEIERFSFDSRNESRSKMSRETRLLMSSESDEDVTLFFHSRHETFEDLPHSFPIVIIFQFTFETGVVLFLSSEDDLNSGGRRRWLFGAPFDLSFERLVYCHRNASACYPEMNGRCDSCHTSGGCF